MKKAITSLMVSTVVSTLLLSTSAFSAESLAQIMATHREELQTAGVEMATIHTASAIAKNNISQTELKSFLKQELSPRDYAKVETSLNAGVTSKEDIQSVVANIGNGANFRGTSCYSFVNQVLLWGGSITAVVMAVQYSQYKKDAVEEKNNETDYVDSQNRYILGVQNEIIALKNEGVSVNSYLISDREAKVSAAKLEISQSQASSATQVSQMETSGKTDLVIAAAAGAAAGITALSCRF